MRSQKPTIRVCSCLGVLMVGLAIAHITYGQTVAKRASESEAAYQARLRAAARERTLQASSNAGDESDTLTKREGESEAAFRARLRAAARNRALENKKPGVVKTPTENDAAYQERLQRLTRNPESGASIPLVDRQANESEDEYHERLKKAVRGLRALCLLSSPLPVERKGESTVAKRKGESEAAYQARLRAAASNRTLSRSTVARSTIAFLDKTSEETYFAYEARLRTTVESLLALLSRSASSGNAR